MSLRYLSVVDSFFPERPAGAGRVAWDVARKARECGHEVTLFCPRKGAPGEDVCQWDGITVLRAPSVRPVDCVFAPWRAANANKAPWNFCLKGKWDVVHIHTPFLGALARKLIGKGPRYCYTVHSPALLEQRINWGRQGWRGALKRIFGTHLIKHVEGSLLQSVDRIHCLSMFTKQAINQFYGVGDKTEVIPHWRRAPIKQGFTRINARQYLDWPPQAKILFTLRRLAPRMGLDVLIQAAAPLLAAHRDLLLVIAGKGELEEALRCLAASLGVEESVWFLGTVDEERLQRCYEASDLFVLPTRALECFGLIILEALSFGLPVVATDVAAIPETLKPILPDFMVPAGDPAVLRKKIEDWMSGRLVPPNADTLRDFVQSHYAESLVVPKLMNYLWISRFPEA